MHLRHLRIDIDPKGIDFDESFRTQKYFITSEQIPILLTALFLQNESNIDHTSHNIKQIFISKHLPAVLLIFNGIHQRIIIELGIMIDNYGL